MTVRPRTSSVQHGDPTCADYGCKRKECLEARRRKQKRNKLLRTTGRPGVVPPDRAAAHIAKFRAAGLMDKEILAQLGIVRNTFYRVLRGLPLTRDIEQRILAVPAPQTMLPMQNLADVPAVGTHRRLRALLWQGWPVGELEQRLERHQGWITRSFRKKAVTMAVAARVVALYDELWNVDPVAAGIHPGSVRSTREEAVRAGYVGPLAWDDDTIDNPAAVPATDAVEPVATEGGNVAARWLLGESGVLGAEDRKDVLIHLFQWTNDTTEEIAEKLGMTPNAAERQWHRMKRQAALEGRRMWRRVYVPRERTMTQNEMEEAA